MSHFQHKSKGDVYTVEVDGASVTVAPGTTVAAAIAMAGTRSTAVAQSRDSDR